MARFPASSVAPGHPDFKRLDPIRKAVFRCVPKRRLPAAFAAKTLVAAEIVLDPVRTARTKIVDLDKVEKTFVGLMIEHQVRDLLQAPKGIKRDFRIGGVDVDLKSTVTERGSWMIPRESYRDDELVMLAAVDDVTREAWLGLMVARPEYLGKKDNGDKKRGINAFGLQQILWLVEGAPWPKDRWLGLDMKRFRELRQTEKSSERAASFFRENLNRPVHRRVVQALMFDQADYMKRLRVNGGARDILGPEGISLLWGLKNNPALAAAGFPTITSKEVIAVRF